MNLFTSCLIVRLSRKFRNKLLPRNPTINNTLYGNIEQLRKTCTTLLNCRLHRIVNKLKTSGLKKKKRYRIILKKGWFLQDYRHVTPYNWLPQKKALCHCRHKAQLPLCWFGYAFFVSNNPSGNIAAPALKE